VLELRQLGANGERGIRKGRLYLALAALAGLLLAFAVILNREFLTVSRLLVFPSIIACIVFLGLYAKSTRQG